VEWSFLEYTNVGIQDKNLMEMGLTYLEMQVVLKCNQNIYTDMYENSLAGHYNIAGNFKEVDAFGHIIYKYFSQLNFLIRRSKAFL
jgi:hypothetical protein